jgi:hypothetical protein
VGIPHLGSAALQRCDEAHKYNGGGCNRVVYYESFDDVHKAVHREKQSKRWTRAKKIALIESKNARWEDLAENWGAEMLFAGESIHELSSLAESAFAKRRPT